MRAAATSAAVAVARESGRQDDAQPASGTLFACGRGVDSDVGSGAAVAASAAASAIAAGRGQA